MLTDEQLIARVQLLPIIWDQSCPAFRNQNQRLMCWSKLATETHERPTALKDRWCTLRRKYYRERQKQLRPAAAASNNADDDATTTVAGGSSPSGSQPQQQPREVWPLLASLQFLDAASSSATTMSPTKRLNILRYVGRHSTSTF